MNNFDNDAQALSKDIYNTLRIASLKIGELVAENDCDMDAIKGGKYSPEGVREIQEGIDGRKAKINEQKKEIEASLSAKLDRFEHDHTPHLEAKEITEDTNLLNCGVTLNANEITALLDKNAGNYTMTTILLRYAEEHGLNLDYGVIGKYRASAGHDRLRKYMEGERGRLTYSLKHIDRQNGRQMIDRFFGIES